MDHCTRSIRARIVYRMPLYSTAWSLDTNQKLSKTWRPTSRAGLRRISPSCRSYEASDRHRRPVSLVGSRNQTGG